MKLEETMATELRKKHQESWALACELINASKVTVTEVTHTRDSCSVRAQLKSIGAELLVKREDGEGRNATTTVHLLAPILINTSVDAAQVSASITSLQNDRRSVRAALETLCDTHDLPEMMASQLLFWKRFEAKEGL